MAAVAKDDDDDYDLEEDDNGLLDAESSAQLAKQRKLLATVAKQVQQNNQAIDFDDMEDHDEIMRQIYQENLLFKHAKNGAIDSVHSADQLL